MVTLEENDTSELCEDLNTLNGSLIFMAFIVVSVLLSYWVLRIQRRGLCLTIQGDAQRAQQLPDVFPLQLGASALVVGSLGYFFTLNLDAWAHAEGETACRSARLNVIAGFLVLLAALIRLYHLNDTQRSQPALTEELLPD